MTERNPRSHRGRGRRTLATATCCLALFLTVSWGPRLAAAQDPSKIGGSGGKWSARAEVNVVRGELDRADTMTVRAFLTNRGPTTVEVEHGACPVRLHAFRTAARENPVWQSEQRAPWEGGYEYACPLYLALHRLGAGEGYSPDEFLLTIPTSEILADSIPDGRYHFTVLVDAASTTFRIPAGDAELRLERRPLPPRRLVGLLTYEAEMLVSRTRPPVLRAEVTGTLTHADAASLRFSADCPVLLHVYRSRERRDAAPLSGEPVWRGPGDCRNEMRELPLVRNQEVAFAVEASASDILGPSLPAGRYYFAVVVQLEGRRVYLSAGEAELQR